MTTAVIEPQGSGDVSRYGAFELKDYINKSTIRSFIITISLLLLLFLLWFVVETLTAEDMSKRVVAEKIKIDLSKLPPPPQNADMPPPPPPPRAVQMASGPAARAGTPVPVPDDMIAPDVKEFASTDQINRATAEGGEGEDFGGTFDTKGAGTTQIDIGARETMPDPDEFVPVEKEPIVDLDAIKKRIVYPDMAKRSGVEGRVIVKVWIDKSGKPSQPMILQSANTLLNDAAMKAIMGGTYIPAVQNGYPVGYWTSIPIVFSLR